MMKNLSVIIPTFNRASSLRGTILSFLDQSLAASQYEILVCDNRSTDETRRVIVELQTANPGRITYLYEPRQGVHYARNSAALKSAGEILYFTDDDMIADKYVLFEILKTFECRSGIGVATGLILPRFDTPPPKWVIKHLHNHWLSLTDRNRTERLVVSPDDVGVYSCHQAIKRGIFFESGGFNPENTAGVWVGDGETGLNLKIKKLGAHFAYSADAVIYHVIPASRTTLKYLVERVGNKAFCDAYTAYRNHRNISRLLLSNLFRNTIRLPLCFLRLAVEFSSGKTSWRFFIAFAYYYVRFNMYESRILFDRNFRKFVEIDDWFSFDTSGDVLMKAFK